jgi:phenylalanyl-tRNA synthetase beta chain
VRFARASEKLALLNGETAELEPDMLVIADATGPVALAGIMGGQPTSVEATSVDVFLEAAFFAPQAIAGRARRLGLSTDSSHRFERGVDFGATREAMERATQLLLDICGGQAGPITDVVGALPQREPITLRLSRLKRVAGVDLDADQVARHIAALGARVEREGDNLVVIPPSFRFDLAIEEDLIEEAVRLFGYDNVPAQPPAAPSRMLPQDEKLLPDDTLRQMLVDLDYQEVITYSFVDPAWETALNAAARPLPLANPLATQLSAMRTTLWGGLLETLRHNLNHQQDRVRIFELGRVYLSQTEQPTKLGGLVYGDVLPEQWGERARRVDFFDLKGDLERLFGQPLDARSGAHPALHPGQSAELWADGRAIGWIGTLHPRLVQAFDLAAAPVLFELDSSVLAQRTLPRHATPSRFPQVRRDLAFVLDVATPVTALLNALRAAAPVQVRSIDVFDDYRGKGVPENQKSLAIRVVMQDTQRTLTDQEVEDAVQKLVDSALSQCNASLRA